MGLAKGMHFLLAIKKCAPIYEKDHNNQNYSLVNINRAAILFKPRVGINTIFNPLVWNLFPLSQKRAPPR